MNFNRNLFDACSPKRYTISQGGSSSGKTYSILYYLITIAIKYPNLIISIVSESLPHLKRGAMRDFKNIIESEGFYPVFSENISSHTYTLPNKTIIEFFGAEDSDKLRGSRRDVLFINECNNVSYDCFTQLDIRTKRKVLMDFNPIKKFWVHDILMPQLTTEGETKNRKPNFTFIQSTYKDNPFVGQEIIDGIERRKDNANWYKVFALGEIGEAQGLVFSNWDIVGNEMPGSIFGFGLDLGFVHSPSTLIQINEYEGELYMKEYFYKTGMSNDDIWNEVVKAKIDLTLNCIADNAEPKTIDYLHRKGWKGLKPSIKGPDSIDFGLNLLLDRKIHVCRDSLNIIDNFRKYCWEVDKDGKSLNRPVKDDDHTIDAMRYCYSHPKQRKLAGW